MGKNKEKRQKSGDLLGTAPACDLPACEKLPEDRLHTSRVKEPVTTDVSTSLESATKTPKKKRKREHLSEQRAENSCSKAQSSEGDRESRKIKKNKKLKNKEADRVIDANDADVERSASAEEPLQKKKKGQKAKEVNEAAELETPSHGKRIEPQTRRKKRKRVVSKENTAEGQKEMEAAHAPAEMTTRSNKEAVKKKKKDNSKHKAEQHGNAQNVFPTRDTRASSDIAHDATEQGAGVESEKRGVKESAAVDACLLNQLKEFIPGIESKEPGNICKMIKYDLARFQEFKKKGVCLNRGRFTAQENERLRSNVRDFMVLTAIDRADKLFFTHRFKQEQENIKKLKLTHRFFERIAEGIPRSCYYVYARGRKMFDEQNYQGEFTKEELHTLSKLHTLHGSNWKKISELTGRSAFSLQKRYTQLAEKQGPWSTKEVQRLLRAVRDHVMSHIPGGAASSNGSLRALKETLYKRLPWLRIAMKVKTRSWTQCREKWMGILAARMSFGAVHTEKKSLDVQVKLIKRMYEMDVDDAAIVNWEDLTALIGDVPPAYVQRKWHKLKVCYVPDFQRKCFADIVDFLYEKVLANLEQKLMSYQDLDETQHKENEESYLLSDIFQDINEEVDVENDDEEEDNETRSKEKETE